MREIKFRAWDDSLEKMISPENEKFIFYFDGSVSKIVDGYDGAIEVDNTDPALHIKIMQYTGLKDKNGVEIYEGDIYAVKLHPPYVERVSWQGPPDCVGVVFWDLDSHRLRLKGIKDQRYASLIDICDSESEVIGNIYENPELLERENAA